MVDGSSQTGPVTYFYLCRTWLHNMTTRGICSIPGISSGESSIHREWWWFFTMIGQSFACFQADFWTIWLWVKPPWEIDAGCIFTNSCRNIICFLGGISCDVAILSCNLAAVFLSMFCKDNKFTSGLLALWLCALPLNTAARAGASTLVQLLKPCSPYFYHMGLSENRVPSNPLVSEFFMVSPTRTP